MQADLPPIFPLNRSHPAVPVSTRQALRASGLRRSTPITPTQPADRPEPLVNRASDEAAVKADAETFLHRSGRSSVIEDGVQSWLHKAGLNVRKASKGQHLDAIAHAYAAYVRIVGSPAHQVAMAELAAVSGQKRSKSTHDLHLIVPHFVSYGGETPAERLAARKLVSRDVRAIQHLEAKRVLPSRVQALGAAIGEGLHAWARHAAVSQPAKRKVTEQAATKTRSEQRQRALIHEVTIITRRPDGTLKRRARVQVTGAITAEITAIQQRLQNLAGRSFGERSE